MSIYKSRKSKKTRILITVATATVLGSAAATAVSCSVDSNIYRIDHSVASADTTEINVVAKQGDPIKANLTGTFLDKDNNIVDSKVKWLTNLDGITEYLNIPEGFIEFSEEDGVLTVDPNKCPDPLFSGSYEFYAIAQTTNSKLKTESMKGITININCTYDENAPRYAKIQSQTADEVNIAVGPKYDVEECNFQLEYYSSKIGIPASDTTIWTIEDRGGLPDDIKLSIESGSTIRDGLLKIDAKSSYCSANGTYTVTVKGQSKKCPDVYATGKVNINVTGDSKITDSQIVGADTINVDPNVPTIYTDFNYDCHSLNSGGVVIDNAPFDWALNSAQLKVLKDDGIEVEMRGNSLRINTSAAKVTTGKTYKLQLTATPWLDATKSSQKIITINLNNFDTTPVSVGINEAKQVATFAKNASPAEFPLTCKVENKSRGQITTSTPAQLEIAPNSEQTQKLVDSGIVCNLTSTNGGYLLTVDTSNILDKYVQLQTDFTLRMYATYNDGDINIKTTHDILLRINPSGSSVDSSVLTVTGPTSIRAAIGNKNNSDVPVFSSNFLASTGQTLRGYKPQLSYTVDRALPDGVTIAFEEEDDSQRLVVTVPETTTLDPDNNTYNITVTCNAYYDIDGKTIVPISDVTKQGSVTVEMDIVGSTNTISTANETIELKKAIDPNILCTFDGGDTKYYLHFEDKNGQIHDICAQDITKVQVEFCDPTVTEIKDNFLRGCLYLDPDEENPINLSGLNNIRKIGNDFLRYARSGTTPNTRTLDLTSLTSVKEIGTDFLLEQTVFNKIDLSASSNLTSIGSKFINGYHADIEVVMGDVPFTSFTDPDTAFWTNEAGKKVKLYVIDKDNYDKYFSNNNDSYRDVDVSVNFNYVVYNGVTYILKDKIDPANLSGQIFQVPLKNKSQLKGGSLLIATELMKIGITKIGLSSFKEGTTEIPDYFLYECSQIESIDLGPLSNITKIGAFFLGGCSSLKSLDLSPLKSTVTFGEGFGFNCKNLIDINLGSVQADNFSLDGEDFTLGQKQSSNRAFGVGVYLHDNTGEEQQTQAKAFAARFINHEGQDNVKMWRYLMAGEKLNTCTNRTYENGLKHLIITNDSINLNNDLRGEAANTKFNFTLNQSVSSNTHDDLINLSLRRDNLSVDSTLQEYFLSKCYNLLNLYIKPMENVTRINNMFLQYNKKLQDVDLSMFPNVTYIESKCFLKKCQAIKSVDFTQFVNSKDLRLVKSSKGDPAFCDCYNLVSFNMAHCKKENLDFGSWAFSVRNHIAAPTYALGCLVTGDDAEWLVNTYVKKLEYEKVGGGAEDCFEYRNISITGYDLIFRIEARNLRLSTDV